MNIAETNCANTNTNRLRPRTKENKLTPLMIQFFNEPDTTNYLKGVHHFESVVFEHVLGLLNILCKS